MIIPGKHGLGVGGVETMWNPIRLLHDLIWVYTVCYRDNLKSKPRTHRRRHFDMIRSCRANFISVMLLRTLELKDTIPCVGCEAWSTHRDHDSVVVIVGIVTLLVSDG